MNLGLTINTNNRCGPTRAGNTEALSTAVGALALARYRMPSILRVGTLTVEAVLCLAEEDINVFDAAKVVAEMNDGEFIACHLLALPYGPISAVLIEDGQTILLRLSDVVVALQLRHPFLHTVLVSIEWH